MCGQFFAPVSFPQILDLGLRVNKLGKSSVEYEVGVFVQKSRKYDDDDAAAAAEREQRPVAVGGYTHVFVESRSRKSVAMSKEIKEGLAKLDKTPVPDATAKL